MSDQTRSGEETGMLEREIIPTAENTADPHGIAGWGQEEDPSQIPLCAPNPRTTQWMEAESTGTAEATYPGFLQARDSLIDSGAQAQRAAAVMTAHDALMGRPGLTSAAAPSADDVARLAEYIVSGGYPLTNAGVLMIPETIQFPHTTYTQADIDEAINQGACKGWHRGYSERPLYDGQNRGQPIVHCPYHEQAEEDTTIYATNEPF